MDAGGFPSLSAEAQTQLQNASYIIGPQRHLSMLPSLSATQEQWPVPFSDGIDKVLNYRHSPVVMLVSGDPFWFGAGTQITKHLDRNEWQAIAGQSCFSLAASALGWAIEQTDCLGLHAANHQRLRPYLSSGRQIMATLRDGDIVPALAQYLTEQGFGASSMTILEQLGSAKARITTLTAESPLETSFHHPLMVALKIAGNGPALAAASGIDDSWFIHDGQITKQPIRALTLSALAPQAGQHLWDIGSGSGSIAIEWLLSGPNMRASAVEKHPQRAQNIRQNAERLGVDWLKLYESDAQSALSLMEKPDTVFIGGGLRSELLTSLWDLLPTGTRLVANGVTIETDRLLTKAQADYGGQLLRLELSHLESIGSMSGWKAAYPITQWVARR